MSHLIRVMCFLIGLLTFANLSFAQSTKDNWKPNWLMVSDLNELNSTWTSAFVHLPNKMGGKRGLLLQDEAALNSMVLQKLNGNKLPLVLYLHACEGLGHHRWDVENLSKLGFAVIALDSFARSHRPRGCYEDLEIYTKYYDIDVAFRKAELDYAVNRIKALPWVDNKQQFLIGSGLGGMVAAHYQGAEFSGIVIEGWGCRHPLKAFDGIWAPPQVRVYSVVSKNDRWYKKDSGFGIDCASFLTDRLDSVSVVLDRPAHYVSWYPNSRETLIKFLTRDMDVDQEALIDDTPIILDSNESGISLRAKWSGETVYSYAREYCSKLGKASHLIASTEQGIFKFVCS